MSRIDSSYGRLCAAWGSTPQTSLGRPAPPMHGEVDGAGDRQASANWIDAAPSQPYVNSPAVPWVMVASRAGRVPALFDCGLLGSFSDPDRVYRIEPVAIDSLEQLERRCRYHAPRLLVIDLTFAIEAGADGLHHFKRRVAASDLLLASFATMSDAHVPLLRHARGCIEWSWSREELMCAFDAVIDGMLWFPKPLMQALYLSLLSELDAAAGQPARAACADDNNALTMREIEVLALMRQGLTNREIGERMGISVNTVKKHLVHVFEKRGLRGRRQAFER